MNKTTEKLESFVQLQAYADSQTRRDNGENGKHITQWAVEEIERLNAELAKEELIAKELFKVIESYQKQMG